MKNILIIIGIIIINSFCLSAQKTIWVVTQLKDTSISSINIPDFDMNLFTSGSGKVNSNNKILPTRNDDVIFPIGLIEEKLIFTFYDYNVKKKKLGSKLKLFETGIKTISIIVDNEIVYTKEIKEHEKIFDVYHMGLEKLHDVKPCSIIQIKFSKDDDQIIYFNGESAYFKYFDRITPYSNILGLKYFDVWFPMDMYATKFSNCSNDTTGLIFAPMPIGIALGDKIFFENGQYLGISLCINWFIKEKENEDNGEKNIYLQSLAPGLIVDWDNKISLGIVYVDDLTTSKNLGFSLMISFSTNLLNRLTE